jgi:hypothetical protein
MNLVKASLAFISLAYLIGCSTASADRLDLNDPKDVMTANRKIQCSIEDGHAITFWWHGEAYSRRQGEGDKHLFDVEGMNVRQCIGVTDAERGEGYKLVSRELLMYKDPSSGEILKTWENPWTGATVDVLQVANDPVNFTSYYVGRDGKPPSWDGTNLDGRWWSTSTIPLFYPNPLAGDYQAEIGGTYHATEMFNFMGDLDSLLDDGSHTAEVQVGWVRMSDWLPWMMMGGRDGVIYMHTAGRKLDSWDDLSQTLKDEIATNYPDYVDPPPADDARRNETSWLYYKKVRDGERVAPTR